MKSLAPYKQDLLVALALLCLSLVFFWPVVVGGRTLLPADIPYQYAPWSASAAQLGVSVPQNHLLADLILENYAWKKFILESLGRMELPLWNPYLFAGVPFLAAGQHSALYPLSIVFYLLPLAQAYGVFTALQIFIACLGGYVFLRVLGAGRFAAALAGMVYGFSGFMLVSVVFSMVIAAACWLPWALAATELAIRGYDPQRHSRTSPRLLYLLAGSLVLGVPFLAGHVDTSYYILMVLGFYSAWRLTGILWATRSWSRVLPIGLMLLGMVVLGMALAAVQLAPLFELVRANFRQGSASYDEVVGWALPWRRAISFLIPDFFGNPSLHSYFDLLSFSTKAVTENAKGQPLTNIPENIFGVKNYVESGSYLGILPLLLGITAWCVAWWVASAGDLALHGAGRGFTAARLRHPALRHPLLWSSGIQPAPFAIPLDLPVHVQPERAGWTGRTLPGGIGKWRGEGTVGSPGRAGHHCRGAGRPWGPWYQPALP